MHVLFSIEVKCYETQRLNVGKEIKRVLSWVFCRLLIVCKLYEVPELQLTFSCVGVIPGLNTAECTGLFISPSGISEIDCATTKTDTAERSISIGRESLQDFLY